MANKQTTAKQVDVVQHADGSVTVMKPPVKSKRHKGVAVVLDSDDVFREQANGFANFLREYGVVGLAIGFIAGQQANTVVKQLVASFVDPWLQVLFGTDLKKRVIYMHHGNTPIALDWGLFVYTLIELFFVLIVVYVVIKLFRLDKFKKPVEVVKK